jgi:hypothetical protein
MLSEKKFKSTTFSSVPKKSVSFDECWKLTVAGKLEKITPDEWLDMPDVEKE